MKQSLFIGMLSFLMACQSPQQGFTIDGTLTGEAEGGKVYIQKAYVPAGEPAVLDSTVISNGKFRLEGSIGQPGMYSIIIDLHKPGEKKDFRNKKFNCNLYLENSKITFEGDIATLPSFYWSERQTVMPTVKGSATHDLYLSFQNSLKEINDTLHKLDSRYIHEYNIPTLEGEDKTKEGIEIVKAEKEWRQLKQTKTLEFIRNHPASIVAFDQASYFFEGIGQSLTAAQIDELTEWLKPAWEGKEVYNSLLSSAGKSKKTAVGEKYLDASFLTPDGNTVKLSSLIKEGDYTMLEFWASWCGPCRGEIPHLVKIHKKYPSFEIISISLDEKEEHWQKAMKEEGMVWKQLRAEGGMYSDAAKIYNITGVPTCIILDKEGRFYKTNMRGAYLDEFLSEIYSE